jgi:LysM repeat protein
MQHKGSIVFLVFALTSIIILNQLDATPKPPILKAVDLSNELKLPKDPKDLIELQKIIASGLNNTESTIAEVISQHPKLQPLKNRHDLIETVRTIGNQLFLSPKGLGHTLRQIKVKPGDSLSAIARQNSISTERILRLNPKLTHPDRIFPNMKLRINTSPCRALVFKKRFEMEFYIGEVLFRVYPVGLGAIGKDTPVGDTTVSNSRAKEPSYTDRETNITYPYGDPMNPVGSRWIGLSMGNGFGIHGTDEPESIGKSMSKGCVRMRKDDLEELYDYLLPGHTVSIRP